LSKSRRKDPEREREREREREIYQKESQEKELGFKESDDITVQNNPVRFIRWNQMTLQRRMFYYMDLEDDNPKFQNKQVNDFSQFFA
jgi:hypothetical protein